METVASKFRHFRDQFCWILCLDYKIKVNMLGLDILLWKLCDIIGVFATEGVGRRAKRLRLLR